MRVVLLKIGGCLITDKSSDEPLIDQDNLEDIAKEVSRAHDRLRGECSLLLIHGAGSYGHPIVKRTRIHEGISNSSQLIDFAETQRLQNELNSLVCKELINQGLPAIPVQASGSSIMKAKRLVSLNVEVVKELLRLGMIPVLYGVPALDKQQGCSILSGDQIMTYLGKELRADKLVFATDVDGVFTADPKKDSSAELIKLINKDSLNKIALSNGVNADVTGGMLGKVSELKGFNAQVINGNKRGNIEKALLGEHVGTMIELK